MTDNIKVLFASCSEDLIPTAIEQMRKLLPELDLYVVSEFRPRGKTSARWIPYRVGHALQENLERCRAALAGKRVRISAVILQPGTPYWRMRWIAFLLAPWNFLAFNEHFGHFMLRPRSLPVVARHMLWRMGNLIRWQLRPGGAVYTFLWRLAHARAFLRPVFAGLASAAGGLAAAWPPARPASIGHLYDIEDGISVVIPSRNGKDLLARLLPGLTGQLRGIPSETIVVDNGSGDGTTAFLRERFPGVIIDASGLPLSFSCAVNRGINAARYSKLCLLNNDMVLEEGFFQALLRPFQQIPGLFCTTAQIFFSQGARREETGKTVMPPPDALKLEDFPVRCDTPLVGEDWSWVIYGSGGCSLYDTRKLRMLGGMDESYRPAYVEDLDLGFRAWQRGWASVYVAGARVLHLHRATTSRYFPEDELSLMLETNYLKFLARTVHDPHIFRQLWRRAVTRLDGMAASESTNAVAMPVLAKAWRIAISRRRSKKSVLAEAEIFALGSGAISVFPGRPASGRPVILIAAPYVPFPLSHGGAVRMYNLIREAAADYDQILVSFVDEEREAPAELLALCAEIVLVKRRGSHALPSTRRPEVVEEFDSPAFRAVLKQSVRRWKPLVAQLEFTQMAQYAGECAPARTVLVEHDVTLDLYQQLLAQTNDPGEAWELQRQLARWTAFETAAWSRIDRIVTMSEKDSRAVLAKAPAARVACLPNGVDLERFQPSGAIPEPRRLLFIGSFAHLPNVLAVEFFLREVWPRLRHLNPTLHIIAGSRHEFFLDHYRGRTELDLSVPGIEIEGFVADVRPAYERAAVVVAPLLASAGTNIKIMEAMAMAKAIVSTPGGINGLDLEPDTCVIVAGSGESMAAQIETLLGNPALRGELEKQARMTVERRFDWKKIGEAQREMYHSLKT